jgi:hypothetical protein
MKNIFVIALVTIFAAVLGAPVWAAADPAELARAAQCAAEARRIATHVGASVDRQTRSVVILKHPAVSEISIGCPFADSGNVDLYIAWDKARPNVITMNVITSAGNFLTGSAPVAILKEVNNCVTEALKPKAQEFAERDFQQTKIECQAFSRDGGGGSVTISTERKVAEAAPVTEADREAAKLAFAEPTKTTPEEDNEAIRSALGPVLGDPTIPTKVKTFFMMSARILALSGRCPTWKPNYDLVRNAAIDAGVTQQDIQAGGRYFKQYALVLRDMISGTATESREEACATARKSYGEAHAN